MQGTVERMRVSVREEAREAVICRVHTRPQQSRARLQLGPWDVAMTGQRLRFLPEHLRSKSKTDCMQTPSLQALGGLLVLKSNQLRDCSQDRTVRFYLLPKQRESRLDFQ